MQYQMKSRESFYNSLRESSCKVFPKNNLTQAQVIGMEGVFDAFEEVGSDRVEDLAYCLATAYHETGQRMEAVREGFAKDDAGAIRAVEKMVANPKIKWVTKNYAAIVPETGKSYFGRGLVQLTWDKNYKKMGKKLNIDLYHNPDLALDPKISAMILIRGSLEGDFTGKKLSDYLPGDPLSARRVINGKDKAKLIADYYVQFLKAVQAAGGLVPSEGVKAALTQTMTEPGQSPPQKISNGRYIGEIAYFASEEAPEGWLICDGRELDQNDTKYGALFEAIGYRYSRKNEGYFNVPQQKNSRSEVKRGELVMCIYIGDGE